MKLSMWMFADWLKEFEPIAEIRSNEFEIDAMRLFSADVAMNQNTIYIGTLNDLFQTGNDNIICAHRNNLLRLNTDDLESVLNRVMDAFSYYGAWDTEMMNLLTQGGMLQDLFNASEDILGRPTFLLDSYQRALAMTRCYGLGDVDELWDGLLRTGTGDLNFLIQFNKSVPDRISIKGIYDFGDKYFPNESYHYNFTIQNNFLGSATYIVRDHNVSKGELDKYYLFCQYIERWFALHIQEQDSILFENQVRTAITDSNADNTELIQRLILKGWTEKDELCFYKLDAPFQPFSINSHMVQSLNVAFQEHFAFTCDLSICMLCNFSRQERSEIEKLLIPWLERSNYTATAGQIFSLTDSIYENYRFVQVTSAQTEQKTGMIYDGKQYVLPYLLKFMEESIIPETRHPALKLLKKYDQQHKTEFYQTLYVYLKCERNIARTAKEMHLHRNTLLYRLDRLRELTQCDLDDHLVRLHLCMSYEIEKM